MNKPGQVYYLKRHVEGVKPGRSGDDSRLSNHYKNYTRWRKQQLHEPNSIPLPNNSSPTKKFKKSRKSLTNSDSETQAGQGDDALVQQEDMQAQHDHGHGSHGAETYDLSHHLQMPHHLGSSAYVMGTAGVPHQGLLAIPEGVESQQATECGVSQQ